MTSFQLIAKQFTQGKTAERNDDFVLFRHITNTRGIGALGDFTTGCPAGIAEALKTELQRFIGEHEEDWRKQLTPARLMVNLLVKRANDWLLERRQKAFTTLIVLVYDGFEGKLTYAGAGDSGIGVARPDGISFLQKGDTGASRVASGHLPLAQLSVPPLEEPVRPGDVVFVYSDGLWENLQHQLHPANEQSFFREVFLHPRVETIAAHVRRSILAASTRADDLTLLVLEEEPMSEQESAVSRENDPVSHARLAEVVGREVYQWLEDHKADLQSSEMPEMEREFLERLRQSAGGFQELEHRFQGLIQDGLDELRRDLCVFQNQLRKGLDQDLVEIQKELARSFKEKFKEFKRGEIGKRYIDTLTNRVASLEDERSGSGFSGGMNGNQGSGAGEDSRKVKQLERKLKSLWDTSVTESNLDSVKNELFNKIRIVNNRVSEFTGEPVDLGHLGEPSEEPRSPTAENRLPHGGSPASNETAREDQAGTEPEAAADRVQVPSQDGPEPLATLRKLLHGADYRHLLGLAGGVLLLGAIGGILGMWIYVSITPFLPFQPPSGSKSTSAVTSPDIPSGQAGGAQAVTDSDDQTSGPADPGKSPLADHLTYEEARDSIQTPAIRDEVLALEKKLDAFEVPMDLLTYLGVAKETFKNEIKIMGMTLVQEKEGLRARNGVVGLNSMLEVQGGKSFSIDLSLFKRTGGSLLAENRICTLWLQNLLGKTGKDTDGYWGGGTDSLGASFLKENMDVIKPRVMPHYAELKSLLNQEGKLKGQPTDSKNFALISKLYGIRSADYRGQLIELAQKMVTRDFKAEIPCTMENGAKITCLLGTKTAPTLLGQWHQANADRDTSDIRAGGAVFWAWVSMMEGLESSTGSFTSLDVTLKKKIEAEGPKVFAAVKRRWKN